MLKRIPVAELRLGMYIEEMCGSWMDHPFWRARFSLSDPRDLERLQSSSVGEVWIDTDQGADVENAVAPAATRAETEAQVDATLADAASAGTDTAAARADLQAELKRAADACDRARAAMVTMFTEARMGRALQTAGAVELVEEISASVNRNSGAIISLARLKKRDEYTFMHSVAVCALMVSLARTLRLPEDAVREAGLAGLLHDIGKAQVPDAILNKPGPLTDREFDRVRQHPELGHRMLHAAGTVGEIPLDVCLHHHEKVDGSGYPHRLRAENITLYAKMGAVCDVYDAITSDRPYKKGWNPALAIRKMTEWTEGHFDKQIFNAFIKTVGIFPVGSLVRLQSDRLAVVAENNESALLAPRVRAFFSVPKNALLTPATVDLATDKSDRIVGREDPATWGLTNLDRLWGGALACAR